MVQVVIYCRTAHDDGISLAMQERELRHFAQGKGWNVKAVYKEHGSGLTLDRPKLQKAVRAVCTGDSHVLLVRKESCIVRDSWLLQDFVELLHSHGAVLLSASDRLIVSSRGWRLVYARNRKTE